MKNLIYILSLSIIIFIFNPLKLYSWNSNQYKISITTEKDTYNLGEEALFSIEINCLKLNLIYQTLSKIIFII